jgi:hypothetical protein
MARLKWLLDRVLCVEQVDSKKRECGAVEALGWNFVHEGEFVQAQGIGADFGRVEAHHRAETRGRGCEERFVSWETEGVHRRPGGVAIVDASVFARLE